MAGEAADGVLILSAQDVARAMPDVEERLSLASRAMRALVADAELPPKIAVHPRPPESFAHAMPAFVRGAAEDGSHDLLGIKWVTGFPQNASRGEPAILATVLLSDPGSGRVRAVLDGGVITAQRTAAVSGVALRWWLGGRSANHADAAKSARNGTRVAVVGAGAQARSHVLVLEHLLPGTELVIADQSLDRAAALASEVEARGSFASIKAVADASEAVRGARIVLTMVSFGPDRQQIGADALADAGLVLAVDYDMCVPAVVARAAADRGRFMVDERGQFVSNRATEIFAGYPDPSATLGEVLVLGAPPPDDHSLTLVTHLGVGVADLVFADAIVRAAERNGLGSRVIPAGPAARG